MTLRADHVAGAAFILLGIAVFAMSGALPFGRLSAPGAGMMPKLVTAVMMVLAGAIIASGAASQTVASIDWSDGKHAVSVVAIAAVAIALYRPLGFILTMVFLVFALLVIGERRNLLRAAAYSVALTLFAYFLFGTALKAPLERGLFWL